MEEVSRIDCEKAFDWVSRLKKTYQPVKGFEHKIAPKRIEGFEKILGTIINHCGDVRGKNFLDIGCNFGYFCLELAKRGGHTFGIDKDSRRIEVAKCLAKKLDLDHIMFFNENAMEFVENTPVEFDYIILLNVFHHILVQDEERAWAMFNKLIDTSSGVFVMMRNSLKDWTLCDRKNEIPEAVVRVSNATNFVAYPAVHGRVIYLFWKE